MIYYDRVWSMIYRDFAVIITNEKSYENLDAVKISPIFNLILLHQKH